MTASFVMAGTSRLRVMRNGGAVVRQWKIPKPVVLVDTREQTPFPLAENHPNWIGGEQRVALATGDYSVEGMQDLLSLERKSMADAISSTMAGRARFIRSCAKLAAYRWKAILIEATYEDMKTAYHSDEDLMTEAHPNAVCGTLDAIEAKFGIPILYTSRHHALATEKAASWLSKHFTYWWLEQNSHSRVLIDSDGL
ncbi:MAG: ERCC4 domain-containing protein [bacterium]